MTRYHFTLEQRQYILKYVIEGKSIRTIASILGKSPSSVSRELKNRRTLDNPTSLAHEPANCSRLQKAPWVCAGCVKFSVCRKRKYRYYPEQADKDSVILLKDSRRKIRTGSEGLHYLNEFLTPLVKKKHQTLAHIYASHSDEIGISISTLYRYVDQNLFDVKNIDLPRRVRYAKRSKPDSNKEPSVDPAYRKDRDYVAFQAYVKKNPKIRISEMDSVIGKRGDSGKTILTILLRNSNYMFAFLRDSNDAKSVVDIFNKLEKKLGRHRFYNLFSVILTDNGSEFKQPQDMEKSLQHKLPRTKIFYCDARASQQKGRIEKNHEYIRKILPQGTSFDNLTQEDLDRIMNHINSVKRKSLGNRSPFECLTRGQLFSIRKLGYHLIDPNEVCLSPSILKK